VALLHHRLTDGSRRASWKSMVSLAGCIYCTTYRSSAVFWEAWKKHNRFLRWIHHAGADRASLISTILTRGYGETALAALSAPGRKLLLSYVDRLLFFGLITGLPAFREDHAQVANFFNGIVDEFREPDTVFQAEAAEASSSTLEAMTCKPRGLETDLWQPVASNTANAIFIQCCCI
jgi:hypothetical protein